MPSLRGDYVVTAADGRAAVLTQAIQGHSPGETEATRSSMADLLSRIHVEAAKLGLHGNGWTSSLRLFDWSFNPWWDLDAVVHQDAYYPQTVLVRQQLELVPSILEGMAGLPECLGHNDFHRGNLIAQGERIVDVVDWDWATVDWRVIDVAAGMGAWMFRSESDDYSAAVDFVERYGRSVDNFTETELRALRDILFLRSLWTVFYDLGRSAAGRLDSDAVRYRFEAHRRIELATQGLRKALHLT